MNISLRNSLAALLLMAASTGALAEQNKVVSPDGRLVVNVKDRDGRLYYDVSYDGKLMMQPSQLASLPTSATSVRSLSIVLSATMR